MKNLVTGATGFIGSALVKKLLSQGYSVRALVLPGEDSKWLKDAGVEVVFGDLTERNTITGICKNIDTVFHCAARVTDWGTKRQFYRAIYHATHNLLEESKGNIQRFVYLSSIAALGLGSHLKGKKETDPPQKSGIPYNDAKADTEIMVRQYHENNQFACTIVRPANVTGPGSVWVRDIVARFASVTGVPLIDGGRYSASLVYVDNLVDGIIRAGTMKIAEGKTYHFRDDWNVTWERYITDLGKCVGKRPQGNIPYTVAWYTAIVLEGLCNALHVRSPLTRLAVAVMGRDNDVDTQLTQRELGWKTIVTYEAAMEEIAQYIQTVLM
ncbi:MAG: NAD-dependent epimerase/dehydratase family protein [Spirochaetes bacterium]|nr:NAD-dependent epimerase/dehydratase family protein [Spirochaetota bacterium]